MRLSHPEHSEHIDTPHVVKWKAKYLSLGIENRQSFQFFLRGFMQYFVSPNV